MTFKKGYGRIVTDRNKRMIYGAIKRMGMMKMKYIKVVDLIDKENGVFTEKEYKEVQARFNTLALDWNLSSIIVIAVPQGNTGVLYYVGFDKDLGELLDFHGLDGSEIFKEQVQELEY